MRGNSDINEETISITQARKNRFMLNSGVDKSKVESRWRLEIDIKDLLMG